MCLISLLLDTGFSNNEMSYRFVPETRLLTLEQLDHVFEQRTFREFAVHAVQSLRYRLYLGDPPEALYPAWNDRLVLPRHATLAEQGMFEDIKMVASRRAEGAVPNGHAR